MKADKLNLDELLKQSRKAQEDFNRKMRESKAAGSASSGQADGRGVKVVLNGNYEAVKIEIDPGLATPDQISEIERLVLEAVNEAVHKLSDPMTHLGISTQMMNEALSFESPKSIVKATEPDESDYETDEEPDLLDDTLRLFEDKLVDGSAGAGLVSVMMNGLHQLIEVKIDPEALVDGDIDMLEALIAGAINNATEKVDKFFSDDFGFGDDLQF